MKPQAPKSTIDRLKHAFALPTITPKSGGWIA